MNDLISRQAAIAEFSCCELTPDGGIDANYAIDFLKQLPSVQPETNCSEIPNNSDLIERQAAIDAVADELKRVFVENRDVAEILLKSVPSAQPERMKGEWLPQDHNKRTGYVTTTVYYYPKCSECGHTGNYGMNYCPSCGADMRSKQDE